MPWHFGPLELCLAWRPVRCIDTGRRVWLRLVLRRRRWLLDPFSGTALREASPLFYEGTRRILDAMDPAPQARH